MFKIMNITKNLAAIVFAATVFIGSADVFTSAGNCTTICIGGNSPMNRTEFDNWRNQRGIRFFDIEGRIYPAGIFFTWAQGRSFSYSELRDETLYVAFRPGVVIDSIPAQKVIEYADDVPRENPLDSSTALPVLPSDCPTTQLRVPSGENTSCAESACTFLRCCRVFHQHQSAAALSD
jgi:hypothetical protein